MSIQVKLIESNPYFNGLKHAELERIAGFIFERTVKSDDVILFEDEYSDALYFVVSGVVKAFKTSSDGKEQILYLVRPGEAINDIPALDGGSNPISARAMGTATLYGIRSDALDTILRDYPQIALNATKALSQRARLMISLVEDLSFRHVINRVAKILLEHSTEESGIRPRLTQQEMAAMAGTAREMIGRSLKSLEDEGVVRLDRQRVVITDKEALKELAGVAT
ncbi:MAG: Crp/Fnr family transcriptional regulator [Chloroflexota bacterium]|nr:Crp/Fnr family transcriptional regulator [Chloroflexota bacterium]